MRLSEAGEHVTGTAPSCLSVADAAQETIAPLGPCARTVLFAGSDSTGAVVSGWSGDGAGAWGWQADAPSAAAAASASTTERKERFISPDLPLSLVPVGSLSWN
jgi:hypothetical protein